MGLVDALFALKGKREEWRLEAPMREALLEKAKAESAATKTQMDMMNKMSKIWDGFNKENPNFMQDVQAAEQEAAQPQQPQPQGLTDMMTQFAPSFGDRATGMNEGQGIMPQGDISQMPAMQPAQAAQQPQQPQQAPTGGNGSFQSTISNPAFLMAAKAAGIDLTSIGSLQERMNRNKQLQQEAKARLEEQKRGNDIREVGTALDIKRYNRESSAFQILEQENEQGETEKVLIPKYTGQEKGGLSFGDVFKTKPSMKNMPIAEKDNPLWIHPETLGNPPMRTTANEAEAMGYVRVPLTTVTRVNDFRAVSVLVNQVESLMEKVFPAMETKLGRFSGAIGRKWGAITQFNPDAALLHSMLQGTQAALVRMFEKGTLTDKDIARARKLNVELTDRADVAWNKIKNMKGFISNLQKGFLTGKGEKKPSLKSMKPQKTNTVSTMTDAELLKALEAK